MAWVILILAGAAILEAYPLPGWVTEVVRPQLTVAIVIVWAMLRGWEEGALVGVAAGLFVAFASPVPLGISVVRLALLGVLGGLGLARLARAHRLWLFVAGFGGSLLSYVVSVLGLQATGFSVPWERDLFLMAFPTACLTALITLAVFPVLRQIERLSTAQVGESAL